MDFVTLVTHKLILSYDSCPTEYDQWAWPKLYLHAPGVDYHSRQLISVGVISFTLGELLDASKRTHRRFNLGVCSLFSDDTIV